MIYEIRTYDIKPGSLAEVEKRSAKLTSFAKNTLCLPRSGTRRSGP
jgi:hypothetical protein